jgi:hypothetical protein
MTTKADNRWFIALILSTSPATRNYKAVSILPIEWDLTQIKSLIGIKVTKKRLEQSLTAAAICEKEPWSMSGQN